MVRNQLDTNPVYEPGDGGYTNYVGGGYAFPLPVDTSDFVTKSTAQTITGAKKFGTDTNNTSFEADGSMVHTGEATVWDDINVSMLPPTTAASVPDIIAFNGDASLVCYGFHGTTTAVHKLASSLEILHGYKEGSDIHFHLHWYPDNATAGNIKWKLVYTWFNPGTVPAASTLVTAVVAAPGVAWKEQTTAFTISGAGMKMGSRFVFELQRDPADASDTYTGRGAVSDMGIHYEKDTEGSRTIFTK